MNNNLISNISSLTVESLQKNDTYPGKLIIERERTILDIKEACYKEVMCFYGEQKTDTTIARMDAALSLILSRFRDEGKFNVVLPAAAVKIIWSETDPRDFSLEFSFRDIERHFNVSEPKRDT